MPGLYIHIPFCRQACTYCDFHFSTSMKFVGEMVDAIKRELILRKNYLSGEIVETIYFGGGTPSLIDSGYIESLLDVIQNEYNVSKAAEITLEANPDDLTLESSKKLFDAGINRLSIGIQSFFDEDLHFMNRAHNSQQALSSVQNAKEAGFNNLSIDLIYGIQTSNEKQWEKNLDIAMDLGVDHLSCYALTIEPKTVMADMIRKKKIPAPDDERTSADFERLMERALASGYEHYEISNFARDQKYSRHNTSYWQRKKYLGVGPSAHSYDKHSRQWNVSNNQEYIRTLNSGVIPFEIEILSDKNKFNEYILISLRTMWGIDMMLIENEFGKMIKEDLQKKILRYIDEEFITSSGDNFILTRKGKFFADRIASELFL